MCAVSRKIHCDAGNAAANSTLVAVPIGIGPWLTTPAAFINAGSFLHHGHVAAAFDFCAPANSANPVAARTANDMARG